MHVEGETCACSIEVEVYFSFHVGVQGKAHVHNSFASGFQLPVVFEDVDVLVFLDVEQRVEEFVPAVEALYACGACVFELLHPVFLGVYVPRLGSEVSLGEQGESRYDVVVAILNAHHAHCGAGFGDVTDGGIWFEIRQDVLRIRFYYVFIFVLCR